MGWRLCGLLNKLLPYNEYIIVIIMERRVLLVLKYAITYDY